MEVFLIEFVDQFFSYGLLHVRGGVSDSAYERGLIRLVFSTSVEVFLATALRERAFCVFSTSVEVFPK